MEKKAVPQVATLDDLVKELHKIFDGDNEVDVNYVKAVLEAYKSNPQDWKKYVFFDPHKYTRNLIDTGNGRFNLFALCWSEGQGSCVHSHSDAHCFVKVLHGQLRETLYDWPAPPSASAAEHPTEPSELEQEGGDGNGKPLVQIGDVTYKKDGVTYINDDIGLHRMENPSNVEGTVSLHLYTPPFGSCHKFDEATGYKNTVKMSFWSFRGARPVGDDVEMECSQRINHRWRPLHEPVSDMEEWRCM